MKLVGLEKNGSPEQALINMMVILPGAKDLDEKGIKKEDKTTPYQRRGMSTTEYREYNRKLRRGDEKFHQDALNTKGIYVKHVPKPGAPSYNPFMTARAIGTQAIAIV